MKNLLKLDTSNEEASALAAPYSSVDDRKEIYLKYLIVSALKKQSSFLDMSDSLFYGRKFYSATRLFDFYVNNNLFDLIILKPNSNELLFKIKKDDFHSNIYGYVVARLDEKAENTEILGYFMANDYDNVLVDDIVKISQLKPIEDFDSIEIMDSQLSLDEVSDRFFGLLSEFFDDSIGEADFSELACLLYNSSELREVFAELGRFDRACAELKTNADLLEDNLTSILAQNRNNIEEAEEYNLGDLASIAKDQEDQMSEISSLDDLSDLVLFDEDNKEDNQEDNLEDISSFETLESLEESKTDEEEQVADEIKETTPDDTDSNFILDNLEEDAPIIDDSEVVSDMEPLIFETDEDESNNELPKEVQDEAVSDLNEADLDDLDNFSFVEDNEVADNNFADNGESEIVYNENHDKQISSELHYEQKDVDNLAESFDSVMEETMPDESEYEKKSEINTVDSDTVTQNSEDERGQKAYSEANLISSVVDDELLGLLESDNDDENIVVDNNVIMSLIEDSSKVQNAPQNDINTQKNNTDGYNVEQKYFDNETEQKQDLQLLYSKENTNTADTFPGEGIVSMSSKKALPIKFNKKIAIMAAILVLVGVGGLTATFLKKGVDENVNMAASDASQNNNMNNDQFQFPETANNMNNALPPITGDMAEVNNSVETAAQEDTKIVSSLSKHAGAAPVILKSVAWQIPESINGDAVFNKYLQIAGKNIKMNLASDLLDTDDFAYNNKIKISMTVRNNAPVSRIKVIESSGSKNVDDIVLQSIKQTLKYVNSPVMSTDTGDREVVLVISI